MNSKMWIKSISISLNHNRTRLMLIILSTRSLIIKDLDDLWNISCHLNWFQLIKGLYVWRNLSIGNHKFNTVWKWNRKRGNVSFMLMGWAFFLQLVMVDWKLEISLVQTFLCFRFACWGEKFPFGLEENRSSCKEEKKVSDWESGLGSRSRASLHRSEKSCSVVYH